MVHANNLIESTSEKPCDCHFPGTMYGVLPVTSTGQEKVRMVWAVGEGHAALTPGAARSSSHTLGHQPALSSADRALLGSPSLLFVVLSFARVMFLLVILVPVLMLLLLPASDGAHLPGEAHGHDQSRGTG